MIIWKITAIIIAGLSSLPLSHAHELISVQNATRASNAALRRWLAQTEFRSERPLLGQVRAFVRGAEALSENANLRSSDMIFFYSAQAAVARGALAELMQIGARFAENATLSQWQRSMSIAERTALFQALGRLSASQKTIARSAIALRFRSILVEAEPTEIWNALALQERWVSALERQLALSFPGLEINRRASTHLLVQEYVALLASQLEPLNLENPQVGTLLAELHAAISERPENLNRTRLKVLAESPAWPVLRTLISAKNPLATSEIEGAGEALSALSNALHVTFVIEDELKREELW